jgi:hypothetical protein
MRTCLYASMASLCLPNKKRDLGICFIFDNIYYYIIYLAICLILSALLGLRILQT